MGLTKISLSRQSRINLDTTAEFEGSLTIGQNFRVNENVIFSSLSDSLSTTKMLTIDSDGKIFKTTISGGGSGSTYTFTNGLTLTGSTVKLGGDWLSSTTIGNLTTQGGLDYNSGAGTFGLVKLSGTTGVANVAVSSGYVNLQVTYNSFVNRNAIDITTSNLVVQTDVGDGMKYYADYSTSWTTGSSFNNYLTNKKYVDDHDFWNRNTITGYITPKLTGSTVRVTSSSSSGVIYAQNTDGTNGSSIFGNSLSGSTGVIGLSETGIAGYFANSSSTTATLTISNGSTGDIAEFKKSGSNKVIIRNNGDIEITDATAGIILKDTVTGTRHRVVLTSGSLVISSAL